MTAIHTGRQPPQEGGVRIRECPFLLKDVAALGRLQEVNGIPSDELGNRRNRMAPGQQGGRGIISGSRTAEDHEGHEAFPTGIEQG